MTARLTDAQLRQLEAEAERKVADLAAEVRRLRRLLVEIYPHTSDTKRHGGAAGRARARGRRDQSARAARSVGPMPQDQTLERAIVGAMRAAIHDHGPITPEHIGSAVRAAILVLFMTVLLPLSQSTGALGLQ